MCTGREVWVILKEMLAFGFLDMFSQVLPDQQKLISVSSVREQDS